MNRTASVLLLATLFAVGYLHAGPVSNNFITSDGVNSRHA